MLLILRSIIIIIYFILVCTFGSIWCLLSPRNPRHVATFAHIFGYLAIVLGIKIEIRKSNNNYNYGNVIYISNHQNNYDMIVSGGIIEPNTVTVGKKSLLWIPLFGILYWLSGNLLVDRNNFTKAIVIINQLLNHINRKKISLWIFPEGTRSYGRGILKFKTGAFRLAKKAKVPIIPVVVSNIHNKIKLNRWDNGLVIVKVLPPIDISQLESNSIRELVTYCRELMLTNFEELNNEVIYREQNNDI